MLRTSRNPLSNSEDLLLNRPNLQFFNLGQVTAPQPIQRYLRISKPRLLKPLSCYHLPHSLPSRTISRPTITLFYIINEPLQEKKTTYKTLDLLAKSKVDNFSYLKENVYAPVGEIENCWCLNYRPINFSAWRGVSIRPIVYFSF